MVKSKKTAKQLEREIRNLQYKERAKRMRGFFGDMFKAKDGYDLRKVDSWTPQQKAKVTRYFRVIAPRITGDFIVKRYRKPENITAAIQASLQERVLEGQTAAAFNVDPGEKLEIKIREGRASVKQGGIDRVRLPFNKAAFLEDADAEIDRVLAATDANVFRVITGGQQQNKTLTREDVKGEIFALIMNYRPEAIREEHGQRPFDEWLNGLMAYPGTKKKTFTAIDRFVRKHARIMEIKERNRLDQLAADRKGITVKELRRQRTLRKKRRKVIRR
jgi:hypothetical protein